MLTKQDVIELAVDVEAAMANAGAEGVGLAEISEDYCRLRPSVGQGAVGKQFRGAMRVLADERNRCVHKFTDRVSGRTGRYAPSQAVLERAMSAGKLVLHRLMEAEDRERIEGVGGVAASTTVEAGRLQEAAGERAGPAPDAGKANIPNKDERATRAVRALSEARRTTSKRHDVPRRQPERASTPEEQQAELARLKEKYNVGSEFWTPTRRAHVSWVWEKAKGVGIWALARAFK